ncbi:MAG: carboxypeptidase-like regulatory domain-containing protein [Bacteroidota bacterium]
MRAYISHFSFLVALFVSYTGYGQEKSIELTGKVQSLGNDVSNVLVINLSTKKSTITDATGQFTIEARPMDSIRFSAVQYIPKEIMVTNTMLKGNILLINLKDNIIDLEEVIVSPFNLTGEIDLDIKRLGLKPSITSSSLGLPNADVEIMTQSERLLLEADRGKYARFMTAEEKSKGMPVFLGYLTIGVIINTHKIINRASGRTKLFEELVALDENLAMEKKIIAMFSKIALSESFEIPQNMIDNFLSFCLAQPDSHKVKEAENTVQIWEYLQAKSHEFKKTGTLIK